MLMFFFLIGPVALKQDIKMLMKNGERRKDRVVVLFIPAFKRVKRLSVKKVFAKRAQFFDHVRLLQSLFYTFNYLTLFSSN